MWHSNNTITKKNIILIQFNLCLIHVLLLVCTWRHGGHVDGQEQKHFSPLGTKLYFHVNSLRKYSFVLTPNMAALSRDCKPRIMDLQQRPSSFKYKRFKLKMEKVFPQKYRVQNLKSSCQPCWVQPNFGKKNIN